MLPDIDKKPKKPTMIKMAGYLERKGRMRVVGVRRWKKRWCVLEGKLLLYFKTQSEYTHSLSPCRGSVNMGLVLSVTQRDPCQLQIVTRSQVIIFRTKSKSEQNEWLSSLQDAKNTNQSFVEPKDVYYKTHIMNIHCLMADNRQLAAESKSDNLRRKSAAMHNGNYLQYGVSLDDVLAERAKYDNNNYNNNNYNNNNNNININNNNNKNCGRTAKKKSPSLRKAESDNRISFYREIHGLVRTGTTKTAAAASPSPPVSGKWSCRSRSLSYESVYFKPQEKRTPTAEPAKSQSSRELAGPGPGTADRRHDAFADYANVDSVSRRMSRSVSFFRTHYERYDSDDYDYIEDDCVCPSSSPLYAKPVARLEQLEQKPELPPPRIPKKDEEIAVSMSTVAGPSGEFHNQNANIDVIYVNNNRKLKMVGNEPESDSLVLDYGIEPIVQGEKDDEPPPLPIKKKYKRDIVLREERQYRITDGVYVLKKDNAEEVIYDVPIPHGKLIEHIRRLTVNSISPDKHHANNVIYDDSLEPSLYETLHMTPDSLETTAFPTYKRWSNDSGFLHEEPNSFSPDQTHFEDSLEPVIAMINHDRKIWQNVPSINSTDYFR